MTKARALALVADSSDVDELAQLIHQALLVGVSAPAIKQTLRENLVPFGSLWAATQNRLSAAASAEGGAA